MTEVVEPHLGTGDRSPGTDTVPARHARPPWYRPAALPGGWGAPTPGGADVRRWAARTAMVAVSALALLVRLWRLDDNGFNSDEAVYAGQAASLAGNPHYLAYFPVFRAHPMLVQIMLSPLFRAGEVDLAGRVLVAVLGALTVVAVYALGARLYRRRVGVLAALLVALMPYHVVVTRQVLLDGPMVLFATLTLHCLVRFVEDQRMRWFAAAAAMLGVTMLAKESSVVLVGGVYAFLALTPRVRRPILGALVGLPALVVVFATHPVSQALAGHTSTGQSYLVWQLMRRPNHSMAFYLETVPVALGVLVVAAGAAGLWWLRHQRSWREVLLLCWISAPALAFQLWPVKGFQYLLPVVAPVAVLAARGLLGIPALPRRLGLRRRLRLRWTPKPAVLRAVAIVVVVASLLVPTWTAVSQQNSSTFLAGSGGVPGGREAGRWVAANTPAGSVILTLGPSMANIIQYYGHRRCFGASVSPNPLHRNPVYEPLPNPDAALRRNELHYIVWDRFSAARSTFFSERLLTLARRYHGRVVHTEYVRGSDSAGRPTQVPAIVIYEVRP